MKECFPLIFFDFFAQAYDDFLPNFQDIIREDNFD